MKKLLVPFFLFLFFSASAQMTKDDLNLIQAVFGKDKRDLMQDYMKFKDTASANAFWKIYDSYEAERKKLGQDYVEILQDYANNYDKLDDKKADVLVTRTSANNLAFENLYTKYYKRLKPVVGALKASQFLQMEAFIRNAVKVSILDQLPFIGQLDQMKKPVNP
jgi:hypothetical protein